MRSPVLGNRTVHTSNLTTTSNPRPRHTRPPSIFLSFFHVQARRCLSWRVHEPSSPLQHPPHLLLVQCEIARLEPKKVLSLFPPFLCVDDVAAADDGDIDDVGVEAESREGGVHVTAWWKWDV